MSICLDTDIVLVVPNYVRVVGCIIFCLFLLFKLLCMFRLGLQVLNSVILTESSGLFSDVD